MRSLVFSPASAVAPALRPAAYRAWVQAIEAGGLAPDQMLIIDDCDIELGEWPALCVVGEAEAIPPSGRLVMLRLATPPAPEDAWFTGFRLAGRHAAEAGFAKAVCLEADAFLVSARARACVNALDTGWTGFQGAAQAAPDRAVQVIAGAEMAALAAFCARPTATAQDIPFTLVKHDLRGDSWHARQAAIPRDADFSTMTKFAARARQTHLWWLAGHGLDAREELAAPYILRDYGSRARHTGVWYHDFFGPFADVLAPRSYFEIGTKEGYSVSRYACDLVCVDPEFHLATDALRQRKRTFFFQQTSDAFFAENNLRSFFPAGVDIAFLDGLHLYEFLLRDFMNTERASHGRTLVMLHDCLPLNPRMSERVQRWVDDEEEEIRDWWTGDVWKLLLILAKYRPDLRIHILDCPPTALVLVTGLDAANRVLAANYETIIEEFRPLMLEDYGRERLWNMFPVLDSAALLAQKLDAAALFSPI